MKNKTYSSEIRWQWCILFNCVLFFNFEQSYLFFFLFFLIVLGDGGDKVRIMTKENAWCGVQPLCQLQETACHQRFWLWQLQNGGMKENREVEGFQPWAQDYV